MIGQDHLSSIIGLLSIENETNYSIGYKQN